MRTRRFIDPEHATDRYYLLFVELVALLFVAPSFVAQRGWRVLVVILVVASVVTALRAVGATPQFFRRTAVSAVLLTVVLAALAITWERPLLVAVTVVLAVLTALGPILVINRIFQHRTFTIQDVVGALSVYIQLGMLFSFLFVAVDFIDVGDFFAQGPGSGSDYVYFSFVTMLTLGYGDLTPATDIGRALIMVETLIGQILLVVLVAYLVGTTVTRDPRFRRASGHEDDDTVS